MHQISTSPRGKNFQSERARAASNRFSKCTNIRRTRSVTLYRLILATALLSGCATGYQSFTWTGGYKDRDLGDGLYAVDYVGNGTTPPELVSLYWEQRASELCPRGYNVQSRETGTRSVETASVVGTAVIPISSSHPWITGTIRCN